MTPTPYRICIFTIKQSQVLDSFFQNGGSGTIKEGRRWVEASDLKIKADAAKQPFLVVFAAGETVEELLYYAVLEDIRVHPTKHETFFDFSNMKRFEEPLPHKTELVLVNSKQNISEGHIRPYSICRTPSVLLGGSVPAPPPSVPTPPVASSLTLKNVRSETYDAVYRATEKRMMGDHQIFSTNALAEHGRKFRKVGAVEFHRNSAIFFRKTIS